MTHPRLQAEEPLPDVRQGSALLRVVGLRKEFTSRRARVKTTITAVDSVDLSISSGESVGIVGESGSGKTTLGRCVLRLLDPTAGEIWFEDVELTAVRRRQMASLRGKMQMVFQDPYGSLHPRWTVSKTLEEPLLLNTSLSDVERRDRVQQVLRLVRLDEAFLRRYPHQMSGGQQQRVGIARALMTNPHLMVLDEPTSALDAVTKAGILDLLNGLRDELGLTYIFISHDLGAVRAVADRVAVMYFGRIVETGRVHELLKQPLHPYTRALLSAELHADVRQSRNRLRLQGDPPAASAPPSGCSLHPRCPVAVAECATDRPPLSAIHAGARAVACLRVSRNDVIVWPEEWRPAVPERKR